LPAADAHRAELAAVAVDLVRAALMNGCEAAAVELEITGVVGAIELVVALVGVDAGAAQLWIDRR
jgi:hypothetical protein